MIAKHAARQPGICAHHGNAAVARCAGGGSSLNNDRHSLVVGLVAGLSRGDDLHRNPRGIPYIKSVIEILLGLQSVLGE